MVRLAKSVPVPVRTVGSPAEPRWLYLTRLPGLRAVSSVLASQAALGLSCRRSFLLLVIFVTSFSFLEPDLSWSSSALTVATRFPLTPALLAPSSPI